MNDDNIINILLVEDNPGDITLTEEALGESDIQTNLSVARDGEQAIDFLHKRGQFNQAPTPDLILLDLNLPRKNGREVLNDIKSDPNLKIIPTVVLTTSAADQDIIETYKLSANCYIQKPVDFDSFLEVVKNIEHFWLTIVKLPKVEK